MKITLFTHNAVIGIDAPLCHKSQLYIDDLIARNEADMLPAGSFRRPAARLKPPQSVEQGKEAMIAAAHETSVSASITESEMEANVGIAATYGGVLRAQAKIKAWMAHDTRDERSPLPRGKWVNLEALEVVALP